MTGIWAQAALWLGLALLATLLAIGLRVATALSEIVVGTIAQLVIGALFGATLLAGDPSWICCRRACRLKRVLRHVLRKYRS